MRLLIGGSSSKFYHLKKFANTLSEFNVDCKLVYDADVYDGFPSRKFSRWFQSRGKFKKLIDEFKPDAVFIDRQRHFGLAAIESKLPLFVHLRGDYWKEVKMAKDTLYKSPPKRIALWQWQKIAQKCFQNAKVILPICKHLENRVKEYYPNKDVVTLYQGISPSDWYPSKGMKLNHPCVGLLQGAVIWEKTKEMFTLKKVLESMPEITFYWVGDGPYRDQVLTTLKNYKNFKWLGSLQYPNKIREFLTEIDIYALISGIDMAPLTLLEAQLMEKPVIATQVGGIPELMKNNETGFLVEKGNHEDLINKLRIMFSDMKLAKQKGSAGRNFVKQNFSWEVITKKFIDSIKKY